MILYLYLFDFVVVYIFRYVFFFCGIASAYVNKIESFYLLESFLGPINFLIKTLFDVGESGLGLVVYDS